MCVCVRERERVCVYTRVCERACVCAHMCALGWHTCACVPRACAGIGLWADGRGIALDSGPCMCTLPSAWDSRYWRCLGRALGGTYLEVVFAAEEEAQALDVALEEPFTRERLTAAKKGKAAQFSAIAVLCGLRRHRARRMSARSRGQ